MYQHTRVCLPPPLLVALLPLRAVLHTSASLTLNENASPDVPLDLNVSSELGWQAIDVELLSLYDS